MAKNIFITGGSRGVGLEIAKKFAQSGANIAIVAKTTTDDPRLPGTLWSARDEIIASGAANVRAIACDVRDLGTLKAAIDEFGQEFGHIDGLINNASSIYLLDSATVTEKQFDLMHAIIVRAGLFAVQYALPYLEKSKNAHIVNLAPKPALLAKWFKGHTAYTMCKFASGMMVLGLAEELKERRIAVNAVWPATLLATAAVQNLLGGDKAISCSRHPRIVADAIYYLLTQDMTNSGNYYLDEDLIHQAGLDLSTYAMDTNMQLLTDLYVEEEDRKCY